MARVLVLAALAALLLTAPAAAQRPTGLQDLDPSAAFTIRGLPEAGSVATVGDVDGDGRGDVAIGSTDESEVRVVLAGDRVPGVRSFRIIGVDLEAFATAGPAGDVNGDGLADLVVPLDGATAIVFGRRSPQDIDLGRPEQRDVVLREESYDATATSVGDMNGDGLADLFVPGDEDGGGEGERSRSTIIFGARDLRGTIDTSRPGNRGFVLLARRGETLYFGAGAGDVDGDGLGDLVTASPILEPTEEPESTEDYRRIFSGVAYVVYGRRGSGVIDLGSATAGVTRMTAPGLSYLGIGLAGPGDVNGDGLADVAVGASLQDGLARQSGAAYVVFGDRARPQAVDLGGLGSRGFVIQGANRHGGTGSALAPAGDVDEDGFRDLIVGEPAAGALGFSDSNGPGAAHLVYGGRATDPVRLGASDRALTVRGGSHDLVGTSSAGDVDLDADGQRELLFARPGTCRVGRLDEGDVVGFEPGAAPGPRAAGTGTVGPDRLSGGPVGDSLSGLAGADDLHGRDGHDCIAGGDDDDRLRGGLSGDALFGEAGADAIFGDSGCDRIFGGDGADVIVAGPARVPLAAALRAPIGARDRDDVDAGAGDDQVASGADSDKLSAGTGDDRLASGPADDMVDAGAGDDRLDGGSGDDHLIGEGGADVGRGGAGDDLLLGDSYDEGESSVFRLILGTDDPATRAGPDRLSGGAGDDSLNGGDKDDELSGGSGRDRLDGEDGRDVLRGGAGADRLFAVDGSRDVVDCGSGRDTATVDRRDRVRGCERVRRPRR